MPNLVTIFSPGRINIIGEHIDYNDGFVLPASINLGLNIIAKRLRDPLIIAKSNLVNGIAKVDFTRPDGYTGWLQFLYAVGHELRKMGHKVSGVELDINSNLPLGSGLSSSSALILGVIKAFNELYKLGITKMETISIARVVEQEYIGVMGGIMDQYSITYGKSKHLVYIDCKHSTHTYVPFDSKEFDLVLFDSGVEHNLASTEYNTRRKECEIILKHLNENSFRNLDLDQIDYYHQTLDNPTLSKRLTHILSEFERVKIVVEHLQSNGNITFLQECLYHCHQSLSKNYEVSCSETDYIVDFLYKNGIYSRMMGGGFGGSVLSLIPSNSDRRKITEAMREEYLKTYGLHLRELPISIGDGLCVK